MREILDSVLKKAQPTKKEEELIDNAQKRAIQILENTKKDFNLEFKIELVGSIARGTWISGNKDIDFFLKFDEKITRDELKALGLKIGKEVAKKLNSTYLISYAEHPYTRIQYEDFNIEIVPCYDLKDTSNLKSAVDRTPFHNEYLKKRLNTTLVNEVRIFKQFLKENNLYGAEAKIEGFSGYLCELLILKYHSFMELIDVASEWSKREGIQIEEHFPQREVLKRFDDNLVVVDPIDKFRNVASALSQSNYFTFIYLAKRFKEAPQLTYFFKEKIDTVNKDDLKEKIFSRNTYFVGIQIETKPLVDDVLYPQLKKTAKSIVAFLKEEEILVLRYDYSVDENKILFLIELHSKDVPSVRKVIGPPVYQDYHVVEFLKKYTQNNEIVSGPWIESDRIVIETKREGDIEKIFKKIIAKENLGAGKNIKDDIKNSKLFFNTDIVGVSTKFDLFVYSYLNKSIV